MVMLKPLLPYATDFIGHVLFKAQHMATVHYENGQYHVHKEIAKNTKEETNDKNTNNNKNNNKPNEHIVFFSLSDFCYTSINERLYKPMSTPIVLTGNHQCNYPPPRS
jgi:hypothetical protein